MNESDPAPERDATTTISEPRRLEVLRVVTWYIYALRLLRLHSERYAVLFAAWLATPVFAIFSGRVIWVMMTSRYNRSDPFTGIAS